MAKLANKFEIGCDPEFVVVGAKGELVNVAVLGDHAAGPVAADHGGMCAEVRPDKARGAWTLIKRIQQILKEHPKLEAFRNSRWRGGALFQEATGAKKVSLGGHIHFNIDGYEWCIEQTNALDRVTKYLEGLDILPTVECQARRKHSHHGVIYGHFSDVRYGNMDNHVEYRTMASWLHDPWIAFLALTLAKLAVTAPEATTEKFSGGADIKKLRGFLENFRGKDINADRLLEKFAVSSKWLAAKPDADIKQAWSAL